MWIIAVLTDGPLRGERVEVESDGFRPPTHLDLSTGGSTLIYTLGRATARARQWNYCYVSQTELMTPVTGV